MRTFLTLVANLALAGFACIAVACLLADGFWLFDLFTHFSAYWALGTLVLAIFFFILRCPRRGSGALLLCVFFAWEIAPYVLPRDPDEVTGEQKAVRITLLNLRYSNDEHREVHEFLSREAADIVVLQEFTPTWAAALQPFLETYPYRALQVRDSPFGIAVLSKYPLGSQQWHPSAEDSNPFLSAEVDVLGTPLQLVAMHPPPPVGAGLARVRNHYFEIAGYLAGSDGPNVVMGDLNCTPWSPKFRRLLRETGTRDSGLGFGLTATWHRRGIKIPIDHVLVSAEVGVVSRTVGPDLGSDHRPVTVELVF